MPNGVMVIRASSMPTISLLIIGIMLIMWYGVARAQMPEFYEKASPHDKNLATIAMEFAEVGAFGKAVQAAKNITSHELRGVVIGTIGVACSKAKNTGKGCEYDPRILLNDAMEESRKGR